MLRVATDLLQSSDSGHVSILSLLDLSAAFDTIDHSILITRLCITFGCSGKDLDRFLSCLSRRTQSNFVGHESTPSGISEECHRFRYWYLFCIFILNVQPPSTVICKSVCSDHFFVDNTQLHNSRGPSDFLALGDCLKDCIEDLTEWITDNYLKMTGDKPYPYVHLKL